MRALGPLRWGLALLLLAVLSLAVARLVSPGVRVSWIGETYPYRLSLASDTGHMWLHPRGGSAFVATSDGAVVCAVEGSDRATLSRDGAFGARIESTHQRFEEPRRQVAITTLATCEPSRVPIDVAQNALRVAITPTADRVAIGLGEWAYSVGEGGVAVYGTSGEGEIFERWGLSTPASVAFSPDGRWVAVGGSGAKVALVDAENGDLVWQRSLLTVEDPDSDLHEDAWGPRARRLAFSADGRHLAVGLGTDLVLVLDPGTGDIQRLLAPDLPHHTGSLAFHPEEPLLAASLGSGQVVVWDVTNGDLVARRSLEGAFLRTFRPWQFLRIRLGRCAGDPPGAPEIAFADGGATLIAVDSRRLYRWPSGL